MRTGYTIVKDYGELSAKERDFLDKNTNLGTIVYNGLLAGKCGDTNDSGAVTSEDATKILVDYADALVNDKTIRVYDYPYGDAVDMYNNWCTTGDYADLRVGMIVAVATHPHSDAGLQYGHIGFYVGDHHVMDNVGVIRTVDLSSWLEYYGPTSAPKWGWTSNQSLIEGKDTAAETPETEQAGENPEDSGATGV
jgi:hypothetical protein